MSKIPIGNTLEAVAKSLRTMAELTANGSKNWENYEAVVLDVLQQVERNAKEPSNG